MAMSPFIWGQGGQALTPEQVARKRELAEAAALRAGDTSPVGHWTQGAARVVDALGGVLNERRADRAETAGLSGADEYVANNPVLSALIGGGSSGAPMDTTGAGATGSPVGADVIRAGLIERGLPEHVADGFIMNFQDESGLNPGINEANPLVEGSRGGYGLYQLTGPRRVAYEQFAQQRGVDPADVNAQLDFLMQELQGSESEAAQAILSTQDSGSAAAAIVNEFLRPAEEHRARRVAEYTGGQPQDSSGVVSALASSMSNPWVAKKYGPVIEALMGQQMQRGNMQYQQQLRQSDPMYQAQLAQLQNPAVEPFAGTQVINGQLVQMTPDGPRVLGDYRTSDEGYRPLSPDEAAQMGLPEGAYQIGPDNKVSQIGGAGTNVTVNTGTGPELGKLSSDYGYVLDPQTGQPVIDPATGLPTAAPVPGSPAAQAIASAEAKSSEGDRQTVLKMGTTLENIGMNISELEDGGMPVTGAIGAMGRMVPGSAATDFANRTTQINTRAALDEVQNMRDNSPTGGAVGQLTDSEREAIGLAATSLSNSSSKDEYLRSAKKFRKLMLDIAHGEGNWSIDEKGQLVIGPQGGEGIPEGVDPVDWEFMTPEERALFQ